VPIPVLPSLAELLIILGFRLLVGALCAWAAVQKGRSPVAWFVLGMLGHAFALALLFLLADRRVGPVPAVPIGPAPPPVVPPPAPPRRPALELRSAPWWYAIDRDVYGPVSAAALSDLWRRGSLEPGTLVWAPGMAAWHRIEEVGRREGPASSA
jgi:hypothetical protein